MNPVYCKYSNDRAAEFQIKTMIYMGEDGTKSVRKVPLSKKAEAHVDRLYLHYLQMKESFSGSGFVPNSCRKLQNGVELEFIEGKTLEEYLDEWYKAGRYLEIVEEIKKYRDMLYRLPDNIPFQYTEEFEEVFGKNTQFVDCPSLKISNIDLIFCNLLQGQRWTIIDYEWIFDFPVPIEFIVYRAIHYYLYGSTKRNGFRDIPVFRLLGISDESIAVYDEMERNFQKYVAGEKYTMSELKKQMLKQQFSAREAFLNQRQEVLQLYLDDGTGFCEEHSIKKFYYCQDKAVAMEAKIPEGTKGLRVDPAAAPSIVRDFRVFRGEEPLFPVETNGMCLDDGTYVFDTEDPQIILAPSESAETVTITFSMEEITGTWKKEMESVLRRCRELETEKQALASQNETDAREKEELAAKNHALQMEKESLEQYLNQLRSRFWWRVGAKVKKMFGGSRGR